MLSTNLAGDLQTHLTARHLPPTQTWLQTYLSSIRPNTAATALQRTALFRLLASDIRATTTLSASHTSCFPADIHNASCQSRRLIGPITVQILDVEDIGHSRWSQLETLEAQERGETMKGREVVRVVPGEVDANADEDPSATSASGPHKLMLQDGKGTVAYGMELKSVDGVSTKMNIGTKMVLQNVEVARGVVLLEPRCCTVIGGKIEGLHKAWRDSRKERLKIAAGMGEENGVR